MHEFIYFEYKAQTGSKHIYVLSMVIKILEYSLEDHENDKKARTGMPAAQLRSASPPIVLSLFFCVAATELIVVHFVDRCGRTIIASPTSTEEHPMTAPAACRLQPMTKYAFYGTYAIMRVQITQIKSVSFL